MSEQKSEQVHFYSISNGVIPTGFGCHPVRRDSHLVAHCGPTADGKMSTPPTVEFWCASGWYNTTEARLFAKAIIDICDKADSLWERIREHSRQEELP